MSEAERVKRAVAESQFIGHVVDDLAYLVHAIAARRTTGMLSEDIAQHVLLGIVRHLDRIQIPTAYEYITTALTKTWKRMMRDRKSEAKRTVELAHRILDDLSPDARASARRQAMASLSKMTKFKYY